MGIRSQFALANVTDDQIVEIAIRFQPLLTNFSNPINFSIVKMDASVCVQYPVALGMIAFLSREVFGFDTIPKTLQDRLTLHSDLTPAIEQAWNDLLKLPCIAIAQIASVIVCESYAVIYNDTLCSTGTLRFENGNLISGAVFGTAGSDILFEFDGNVAAAQTKDLQSEFNYSEIIESQFLRYFGNFAILETLMNEQLEELARFQMMDARKLIIPPTIAK